MAANSCACRDMSSCRRSRKTSRSSNAEARATIPANTSVVRASASGSLQRIRISRYPYEGSRRYPTPRTVKRETSARTCSSFARSLRTWTSKVRDDDRYL